MLFLVGRYMIPLIGGRGSRVVRGWTAARVRRHENVCCCVEKRPSWHPLESIEIFITSSQCALVQHDAGGQVVAHTFMPIPRTISVET